MQYTEVEIYLFGVSVMRIAVDALGGDHAPREVVAGAIAAAKEKGLEIVLVGQKDVLHSLLLRENMASKIEIAHADEVIDNDESPALAIRRKPKSSVVVGAQLVKSKQAAALVTAGSTGAFMAAGLFIAGRLEHIDRPALAPELPTINGQGVVLLDAGANMDAKGEHLAQYGLMGSIYAERVLGRPKPKVALLNVGVEEGKGNQNAKDAFALLKVMDINFVGNMEARNLFSGDVDVVVCDGFTGNIMLKTMEGVSATIFDLLRGSFKSSLQGVLAALLMKSSLRKLKKRFDYGEYGGAPLLGVNGVFVKCHGSSKALAIKNGIFQAERYVLEGVVDKIADSALARKQ